jgi:heavy metal sensor kinase
MKFSFRFRLTFWYATIVTLSLSGFSFFNYATTSQKLNENLDASIIRVAQSLEAIIRQKQRELNQPLRPSTAVRRSEQPQNTSDNTYLEFFRQETLRKFVGPVLPRRDSTQTQPTDAVWSAVYEHILLNPKNYLIQVADESGAIVWHSDNIQADSLPLPMQAGQLGSAPLENILPKQVLQSSSDSLPSKKIVSRYVQGNKNLRLLLYNAGAFQMTIGYPMEDLDATMRELFFSFVLTLPFVIVISAIGGWFLAKYFIQPVETIINSADEISATNLSKRIPMPAVNDELAHLTGTINRMVSRLEDSFIQMRQFAGDVSHELRTPLTIMSGELEVALHHRQSPDEYQRIIESTLEEVVRLTGVVKALLEVSLAESGNISIDVAPCNITHLLDDITEDLTILAEEKNIIVHREFSTTQPLIMEGDKGRLHQAILNLMDNAVKYTPDGGSVWVRLEQQGDQVMFSLRDTGIGLAEEDKEKIFHRLYRADRSRAQTIRGHGIGLSIVRAIVMAHHGSIHVHSTLGMGSTFTVFLPLQQPGDTTDMVPTNDIM